MRLEDFSEYQDHYGLIHTTRVNPATREPASQNGLCYTGEVLALLGVLHPDRRDEYRELLIRAVRACEVERGLLQRKPVSEGQPTDQEGPDDYMGVLVAQTVLGMEDEATRILSYGLGHFYVFNNVTPGKFTFGSWLGRMPQVVGMIHWAAGVRVPILSRVWACLSLLYSLTKKWETDQDAYRFSALMILSNERSAQRSAWVAWVGRYWWRAFRKKGYTMRGVLSRYLAVKEQHPLPELWAAYEDSLG